MNIDITMPIDTWAGRPYVAARKPVTVKLACYCVAIVCASALAGMWF